MVPPWAFANFMHHLLQLRSGLDEHLQGSYDYFPTSVENCHLLQPAVESIFSSSIILAVC